MPEVAKEKIMTTVYEMRLFTKDQEGGVSRQFGLPMLVVGSTKREAVKKGLYAGGNDALSFTIKSTDMTPEQAKQAAAGGAFTYLW